MTVHRTRLIKYMYTKLPTINTSINPRHACRGSLFGSSRYPRYSCACPRQSRGTVRTLVELARKRLHASSGRGRAQVTYCAGEREILAYRLLLSLLARCSRCRCRCCSRWRCWLGKHARRRDCPLTPGHASFLAVVRRGSSTCARLVQATH